MSRAQLLILRNSKINLLCAMQERGSGERVKHDIPTVLGLMRRGTLSNGEQMKPFSWLTITTKPKTREELRVERFFESCPFKTGAAGVGGNL